MGNAIYILLSKDYASFSILKYYYDEGDIFSDVERLYQNQNISESFVIVELNENKYYSLKEFRAKQIHCKS